MGRLACVDLPALPLQLLLRRTPAWRGQPVAVVDADRPQGIVLWADRRARASGIRLGMRYAGALSLDGALRAAVVPDDEVRRAVSELTRRLGRVTPRVEPAEREPGVFWLDASGLDRLYESLARWARLIREELARSGFAARVAVGFERFAAYAVARGGERAVVVFRERAEETAAARRVPLDRLALAPELGDALERLGVRSLGQFVDLPEEGVSRRFGKEAGRLHRLAAGVLAPPLCPRRPRPPALERLALERPEAEVARLVAVIERLLEPLLRRLYERCEKLAELQVGFRFERLGDHLETLRTAEPTCDARLLLELVRLRLEALRRLPDAVAEVVLVGHGVRVEAAERELFPLARRDPRAGARALARVRAELGEAAVRRPLLREGHLPEAAFEWVPADGLRPARPREAAPGTLVRRIYHPPLPLPQRERHEPDGFMLGGLEQGPIVRVTGPWVVSGGWWQRRVHREYHFAETRRGELLWVFYDRPRRRWYLQGSVE